MLNYPSKEALLKSINEPINLSRATMEPLMCDFWGFSGKRIFIQRDDLIHPLISGNKWRKLKGWIQLATETNATTLVTFGGAYSNHLVATAVAANQFGFQSVGYLRGDEPLNNHYLEIMKAAGMKIIPLSRAQFKDKSMLVDELIQIKQNCVIPEGGQGIPAFCGFEELVASWTIVPDVVIHASATASTSVGLAKAVSKFNFHTKIISVPVLKNLEAQMEFIKENGVQQGIEFKDGYHFGGYAKMPTKLLSFQSEFQQNTGIFIDPVYNAKALWMLRDFLSDLPEFSNQIVLYLHTGGMLTSYPS